MTTGTESAPAPSLPGVIQVNGLTKRFGRIDAVRGLDFTAVPGRVTGFLGPNGSGKTTTLRMLLGLVSPTTGTATIGGREYRELADPVRRVGAVLEATSFHPARRARSHLKMLTLAAGLPERRISEVLDQVGLTGDARRRVGAFSMGMRQRLELAGALLGDPDVLVLDEPGNGLDPQGIAWLRDFLRHFASGGRTVLVSSHQLAEMSQTVDDVVIISQGVRVAQGPLETLMQAVRPSMLARTPEPDRLVGLLAHFGIACRQSALDSIVIDGTTPEHLGPLLAQNQIVLYELVRQGADLESLFFSLTTGLSPAGPPPGGIAPAGFPPTGPGSPR